MRFTLSISCLIVLFIGAVFACGLWIGSDQTVHAQTSQFTPGGQQAVTGSAVALPSFVARIACLKVVPAGTQVVYVGGSGVTTSTGYPLSAGDSICFNQTNLNSLYVIAANTGSTVAWFGQN